jgi:hypothetical protein
MGIFEKGQETNWRNENVAGTVLAYVRSNPGKTIYEIASACDLTPEQVEWAVNTLNLLDYKTEKNNAYCKTAWFSDTSAHKIESTKTYLKFGMVYCDTQNCYIGDINAQSFLLEAASKYDAGKALPLANVDLSTLYVKAAVSGMVLHIVGTSQ